MAAVQDQQAARQLGQLKRERTSNTSKARIIERRITTVTDAVADGRQSTCRQSVKLFSNLTGSEFRVEPLQLQQR